VACAYLLAMSDKKETLLKALVIGTFFSSLCIIIQSKILFPHLVEEAGIGKYIALVREQPIGFSSFIYHNILGGYFCFIFPIAVYFGIVNQRWFFTIATVGIITGLIFTTSRIAMGITLLSSLVILMILLKKRQLKSILLFVIVIIIGVSLAFTLLSANKKKGIGGALVEIEKKTGITQTATSLLMRAEVWKDGFKAFIAKPVIGHGAGTFEYAYRQHYNGGVYTRYSHSALLKIAIELGVPGVITFLLLLGGGIRSLKNKEWEKNNYMAILFIAFGAGFLFSMVDFALDTPSFFITLIIFVSLFMVEEKKEEAKKTSSLLFFSVIILLLFSFLFTSKAALSTNSVENGNGFEELGLFNHAYESYSHAIKEMPLNDEGFMYMGNLLIKTHLRTRDEDERMKTKAVLESYLGMVEKRKAKDSELIFTKAVACELLDKKSKAELYYKESLFYYPASVYYAVRFARFYLNQGNSGEAKKIIDSINNYREKYRIFKNPDGVFFYIIRDLEAELAYREGYHKKAIEIAQMNLREAETDTFVTSSIKGREFITRDRVIAYLKQRIKLYERDV